MPPPRDDLRLLSIFHYVLAGLTGLFAVFPLLYVGLGVAFVTRAFPDGSDGPPVLFGWLMIAVEAGGEGAVHGPAHDGRGRVRALRVR